MACRGESVGVALVGQSAVGLDGVGQYPFVCGWDVGGRVGGIGAIPCTLAHPGTWEPL